MTNIEDTLMDVVKHATPIGLETVKIIAENNEVIIDGITDDQTVVLKAKTHQDVDGFAGTFGIPNLSKLNTILHLEPYKEDAVVTLESVQRGDKDIPTNVKFVNNEGTFKNYHRFMTTEVINEKLKNLTFSEPESYDVVIQPSLNSIKLMGFQAAISDELVFNVKTDNGNLKFFFGDISTHAGEFVFAENISGSMVHGWHWFVNQVLPILKLSGDITMNFNDAGLLKITVDSGLAEYNYILPAVT